MCLVCTYLILLAHIVIIDPVLHHPHQFMINTHEPMGYNIIIITDMVEWSRSDIWIVHTPQKLNVKLLDSNVLTL